MSKTTKKSTDPINAPKEVKESKDHRIDQDVPGFPHHPSSKGDLKKQDPTDKSHKK